MNYTIKLQEPAAQRSPKTYVVETLKGLPHGDKYLYDICPMGVGQNHPYRNGAKTTIHLSPCVKIFDAAIGETPFVNALCSENTVYGEVTVENKVYRFLCTDGTKVEYEHDALPAPHHHIPFALYAMRDNTELEEMPNIFKEVYEGYNDGVALRTIYHKMVEFCDVFHFGYIRSGLGKPSEKKAPINEISISDNDLQMETVKAAVRSGLLHPMRIFQKMTLPAFTGVNLEEVAHNGNNISFSIEAIKNGATVLPYNWDETQTNRIPSLMTLGNFIPNDVFFGMVRKTTHRLKKVMSRLEQGLSGVQAIGDDYINLIVQGRPGTGKTTAAYALGAAMGMPVYTIALSKNSEEDVFQGMTKVVDGGLKYVPTDFLNAYKNGGIIILEEINLIDPAVAQGALGQAIEPPFTLMQDGYIPVRRHPMCVIIGTMNIGTAGTREVNGAFSSRFEQSYQMDDPTADDFIRILMSKGADKRSAKWVFNAYKKISDFLTAQDFECNNLTMRGCIGALKNIEEGEDPKLAIRHTLVGKVYENDPEMGRQIYETIVENLPSL